MHRPFVPTTLMSPELYDPGVPQLYSPEQLFDQNQELLRYARGGRPVARFVGPGGGGMVRYAFEPSVPSATNTFIPTAASSSEATAGLVVNFSRNPSDFGLPNWASYTPVKKWTGFYRRVNLDQMARILDVKGNDNKWPYGADAPELTWNLEAFAWMPFSTQRFAYGFQLPDEAEQQGDFSVIAQQNAIEAMRAMTQRTQVVVTEALTAANYDSSHVATATSWSGGYVNAGTPTAPYYKILLNTMYRKIHRDTRGCVRPQDCVVVLNPQTAHKISESQEVHTYLKESRYALPQLTGNAPGQNDQWALPKFLYGFRHVVEDSVKVGSPKDGTYEQDGEYIWPWHTVAMFARPGGLIAPEGATSFSTIHVFLLEDMSVEQFDDRQNRRMTSRFVDNFGQAVVAPVSGCLATSALASEPVAFGPAMSDSGPPQAPAPQGGFGISQEQWEETQRKLATLGDLADAMRAENLRLQQELYRLQADKPEEGGPTTTVRAPRPPRG